MTAAASARWARCAGSKVSAAARSRNAAAAASPPRAWARPAERSSSSATSSSGPGAACARCQLRRSGSRAAVGLLGQGPVRRLALFDRRRPVADRPGQRMAEPDPVVELGEAVLGGGGCCRRRDVRAVGPPARPGPGLRSGPPQRAAAAAGSVRQGGDAAPEALPRRVPGRPPCRAGDRETTRQLVCGAAPGQLQQRQGVAARLGDDLVAHPFVQRPGEHRVQQRPRIRLARPLDQELREPRELLAGHTRREDQAERLRSQPTGDEGQDLTRRLVQPLLVVDQAQQRLLLGHLRQQAQVASPTRNGSGAGPAARPKTVAARPAAAPGGGRGGRASARTAGAAPRRAAPSRTGRPAARATCTPGGVLGDVLQQGRLAHARLAVNDQRPAVPSADASTSRSSSAHSGSPALQGGPTRPVMGLPRQAPSHRTRARAALASVE